MSIFHCSIKIIGRSTGRTAVSSIAYRAGEKIYDDETGITHDYTRKGGVIMNEIILPENAPAEYRVREVLWNEVQKTERRVDAQLAREVEVGLPIEMSREEQIECVRAYIKENYVAKGMIADWALHDKGDGNPHAHIMLTCREVNVDGEWNAKTKTVYANAWQEIEKEGKIKRVPIYDPDKPSYNPKDKEKTQQYRIPQLDENGNQKVREREGKGKELLWERVNIPLNDWNEHANAEVWREAWAKTCNRYLAQDRHIDHRSYERQGVDKEPTIHEGYTARKIESEGRISERAQINREIKMRNALREQMQKLAAELTASIIEKARAVYERFKEFVGYNRHAEYSGEDVGFTRRTPDGEREFEQREPRAARTNRRINEFKHDSEQSDKEIKRADSIIDDAGKRIIELQRIKAEKERDRNERIERLRERRAAYNDGADAGRDRSTTEREQFVEAKVRTELRKAKKAGKELERHTRKHHHR